jgi:hypothetical protein
MDSKGETMRFSNRCFLTSVALLLGACLFVSGQAPRQPAASSSDRPSHDWQEIDLGICSLRAPKGLKGGKVVCFDTQCWKYEAEDSVLEIEAGLDVPRSAVDPKKPGYQVNALLLDGASAIMWSYEDQKLEFPYESSIRFYFKGLNEGIMMRLLSKETEGKKLAQTIFKSVKSSLYRLLRSVRQRIGLRNAMPCMVCYGDNLIVLSRAIVEQF